MHLLIGVHVAEFGDFREPGLKDGSPVVEIVEVVGLQRVLILRGTEAGAHAEILHGLKEESSTGDMRRGIAKTGDDFVGADFPFVEWL